MPPARAEVTGRRYRAFLSYAREGDRRTAHSLVHELRRFARAWYQPAAFEIFRDDTELVPGEPLRSSIETAIDDADFFLLLASPAAAASEWVCAEVAHRLAGRGTERLLVVLTDGDLAWDDVAGRFDLGRTTALPPQLLGAFAAEPFWVDLRAARDGELPDEPVADLAAVLHGRSKAAMVGEELRARRRWRWIRNGALIVVTVLALVASGMSVLFLRQRDEARRQTALAEARELASRAATTTDPFASVVLAVESELRTTEPLPVARAAYARAIGQMDALPAYPVATADPGHGAYVNAAAWAPRGDRVATAAQDGSLAIWDPVTGRATASFRDEHSEVWAISWSPGGDRFVTAARDGTVLIRDAVTGRAGPPLFSGGPHLEAIAWSPDGGRIAIGTLNGPARIYDAHTGRPVGPAFGDDSMCVNWSPDGRRLVSCNGVEVTVWDVHTGRRIAGRFRTGAASATWSPDGRTIAIGYLAGPAVLWAPDRPGTGRELPGLDGFNIRPAWSPDGKTLAITGRGLRLWDVGSARVVGSPLRDFDAIEFTAEISDVSWSADSTRFVTGNKDGTVRFWRLRPRREPPPVEFGEVLRGAAFSPDGNRVAGAGTDGRVRLWDAHTGHPLPPLRTLSSGLTGVAWSPSGRYLAVTGSDGALRVLDAANGQQLGETAADKLGAAEPAWSADETRIATLSGAATPGRTEVQIWTSTTGAPDGPAITGHRGGAMAVAWSPWGDRLAMADITGSVRVLDGSSRRVLDSWSTDGVYALAWAPDGRRVATAGLDGLVKFHEVGQPGTTPADAGPIGSIQSLAWSRTGLLAASTTNGVWLLDGDSGAAVAHLTDDDSVAAPVAFAPDGRTLVIGRSTPAVDFLVTMPERVACARAIGSYRASRLSTVLGPDRGRPRCADAGSVRELPPLPVAAP